MSPAEYVTQQLINALSAGSVYALIAVGLAMVFGILRLVNFAHGDLMMVGAYFALFLLTAGVNFWVVLLATMVAVAMAGVIMERVAYRPIRGAADVAMLLTSFAVTIFLENGVILTLSSRSRPLPVPDFLTRVYHPHGNLFIPAVNVWAMIAAVVSMVLLTLFVTRTTIGLSMRAAAEDLMAAELMGININTVVAVAFAIGSAMAAVAGLIWGVRAGKVDPFMGFYPVLKAFVASVIGGFGTIPGAVVGGYALGILEIMLQALLPTALSPYRDAFVFIVLIIILLVRPNGILGAAETETV
ncbi:MAG: branched-chain amino acid ABC transporter permease [Anaerolineae bacterium]